MKKDYGGAAYDIEIRVEILLAALKYTEAKPRFISGPPEYILICSGQKSPPRVCFDRLLARLEYILKDFWQGVDGEHMEIKNPHVTTVLGPFCGPIIQMQPFPWYNTSIRF